MTSPAEATSSSESTLIPFAPNVWTIEGPIVDFFGFPYPTRSVVIRLENSKQAWIWSPVALTEQLAKEVEEKAGPVAYLISPNKIHWLFLQEWKNRFPNAKVLVEEGLTKRNKIAADLTIDGILTNDISHPDAVQGYKSEINQMAIRGGALNEVIFFHKATKTIIVCDLIQRHLEENQHGWKGWLMKADGLVGHDASTPREWRFSFWICGLLPAARRRIDKILYDPSWQPEKMIIAHGENAPERATEIIAHCLRWVPETKSSSPCHCCRPAAAAPANPISTE